MTGNFEVRTERPSERSLRADPSDGHKRRRMSNGVGGLVLLGLTLGALGHVAVQSKRMEVGLELGKAQKGYRELAEEQRGLKLEISRLKDPARIVAQAREKLKMGPPAANDIRSVGGRK